VTLLREGSVASVNRLEAMPRAAIALEQCVARELTRSGQICVRVGGRTVASGAVGVTSSGRTPSADTSYAWSCATKPLVAVVIGMLVDDGLLEFDAPVSRFLSEVPPALGEVTIADLLTHTAAVPDAAAERFQRRNGLDLAEGDRAGVFEAMARHDADPEVGPGRMAAYSVFANWFLLADIVERLLGVALPAVVNERLLEPLRAHAWLSLPQEEVRRLDRAPLEILGPDATRRSSPVVEGTERAPGTSVEILDGRTPHVYIPGGSGVGPVRSLVAVLDAVASDANDDATRLLKAETARQLVSPRRLGIVDKVMGNDLAWGLGVAADRRAFSPRLSGRTFGHVGWAATCLAFADPESEVAVGIAFDREVAPFDAVIRQATVVTAVVADLKEASIL
jgi:CubicO group peptidase (beta-lactamase class C family)